MKPTIKRLFLLISLLLFSSGLYFADAQSYIRYVVPEDFGTHAVYADSVLTSIALPRGVSKLANYPKFNAAAYELSQVLQDPQDRRVRRDPQGPQVHRGFRRLRRARRDPQAHHTA